MTAIHTIKQHPTILLAGDEDCGVVLCPDNNLLALKLGVTTIHLRPESLALLGSLIKCAEHRLSQVNLAIDNPI
jgi:hypothetical protein